MYIKYSIQFNSISNQFERNALSHFIWHSKWIWFNYEFDWRIMRIYFKWNCQPRCCTRNTRVSYHVIKCEYYNIAKILWKFGKFTKKKKNHLKLKWRWQNHILKIIMIKKREINTKIICIKQIAIMVTVMTVCVNGICDNMWWYCLKWKWK